jgi:pantoate--beta-alanine ligase
LSLKGLFDKYLAKLRKKDEYIKNNLSFALFFAQNMLKTCHTITDLQQILFPERGNAKSLGFIPTMGALHRGHLSLIEASRNQCDITVSSIFVNPTQFNDPSDFTKYPRDTAKDTAMLEDAGCDYLFLPSGNEIYPDSSYTKIDFDPGALGEKLEGKFRPGHFAGMTAVVKRLLDIVKPGKAFFGLKDYQQFLLVKKMVEFYDMPVEIIGCPIIREENGLAMSSRNERLSAENRKKASLIFEILTRAAHQVKNSSLGYEAIKQTAKADLANVGNFTVDYFDICSAKDLSTVEDDETKQELIILTAVYIGNVRLIDNVLV